MRVSILDDYQGVGLDMADWSPVTSRGIEVAVERFPFADEDDAARSLADSEIVCAMRERTVFSKQIVDKLPKLKLLITTGMRNASFDMEALKARGVTVCGTGGPRGGNEDTAELAWGLILGAARRIAEDHAFMRQGGWQTRIGHRMAGKTIGCLGLGRLGSAVARVGLGLDVDVSVAAEAVSPRPVRFEPDPGVRERLNQLYMLFKETHEGVARASHRLAGME